MQNVQIGSLSAHKVEGIISSCQRLFDPSQRRPIDDAYGHSLVVKHDARIIGRQGLLQIISNPLDGGTDIQKIVMGDLSALRNTNIRRLPDEITSRMDMPICIEISGYRHRMQGLFAESGFRLVDDERVVRNILGRFTANNDISTVSEDGSYERTLGMQAEITTRKKMFVLGQI